MAKEKSEQEAEGFSSLLAEMPRIAEAVKAFPEAVQAQAFDVLIAEFQGGIPPTASSEPTQERSTKRGVSGSQSKKAKRDGKKATPRRTGNPSAVKDLDLAPKGKKAFKDFISEKHPKTNHDKNVISVYYLAEVLGHGNVTIDHVFTCYKDMRWREPGNLANSLALTANRKRFLNTANLDGITLTPPGRNHVEHDLPPRRKGE